MKAIKRLIPEPIKGWYRHARYQGPITLRTWFRDDPSQAGEVSVLRRLIGPDWPRALVDVGANDGRTISNTYPFVRDGWRALLLEPQPETFARLRRTHAGRANAVCLDVAASNYSGTAELHFSDDDPGALGPTISTDDHAVMVERRQNTRTITIRVEPLTDLLARNDFPADFSLLSIDAEGVDLEVLQGLDFARYRPRLIVTEEFRVHARREGAKLQLLRDQGYRLYAPVGCNEIWARADLDLPAAAP